jgi:hypothetical protein
MYVSGCLRQNKPLLHHHSPALQPAYGSSYTSQAYRSKCPQLLTDAADAITAAFCEHVRGAAAGRGNAGDSNQASPRNAYGGVSTAALGY